MKPATQDNVRVAWFGPLTAKSVALKHHLSSARQVQKFWEAEKVAGRLPVGTRPHFTPAGSPAPVDDNARDDAVDDGVADASSCIPAGDPLLARLRAEHGEDRPLVFNIPDDRKCVPRAMLNSACAHVLAREWDQISMEAKNR